MSAQANSVSLLEPADPGLENDDLAPVGIGAHVAAGRALDAWDPITDRQRVAISGAKNGCPAEIRLGSVSGGRPNASNGNRRQCGQGQQAKNLTH